MKTTRYVDEDPGNPAFFIRTSKFWPRLVVLKSYFAQFEVFEPQLFFFHVDFHRKY